MNREKLLELAERCEKATGPDRKLDGEIDEQVWGWCKDHNMPPPAFTRSLDAAMPLIEGYMLVELSDIAADGLTGCCLCSDTATNPPTEHWGIPLERGPREQILARAVSAAALRARASREKGDG